MNNRYKGDTGTDCLLSVDGTDCPIWKSGPRWWSHKFKKSGVRYELGVAIHSGDIASIHGPYPCGEYNDIKIFRLGLKHDLDEGERVKADLGYAGDSSVKVPGPLYVNKKYRAVKRDVAARHETVNMRIKIFNCLTQKFRHSVDKHSMCFRALAVLTQLAIERGEPLYSVEYSDDYEVYAN